MIKNLISIVIVIFASVSGAFCQFDIFAPSEPVEVTYSALALRMIENDPSFTLEDFAELYWEYMLENDYASEEDSEQEFIETVIADARFTGLVQIIDSYKDESFRKHLAMDILHLSYESDADLEDTADFLERITELSVMAAEDEDIVHEEEFQEAFAEVMEYFFRMIFSGIADGLGELFMFSDFDDSGYEEDDAVYDYDDVYGGEIIEF